MGFWDEIDIATCRVGYAASPRSVAPHRPWRAICGQTTNFSGRGQLASNNGCQVGLIADDLDLVVVYADFRSDNLKVGLPDLDIGGFDLLPDQIHEGGNAFRCQST